MTNTLMDLQSDVTCHRFEKILFLELFGLIEGRINTEHMTSDALMTAMKTMEELTKNENGSQFGFGNNNGDDLMYV